MNVRISTPGFSSPVLTIADLFTIALNKISLLLMFGIGLVVSVAPLRGEPIDVAGLLTIVIGTLAPALLIMTGIVVVWIGAIVLSRYQTRPGKCPVPTVPTAVAVCIAFIPCYSGVEALRALVADREMALSIYDYAVALVPCWFICEIAVFSILKFVSPSVIKQQAKAAAADESAPETPVSGPSGIHPPWFIGREKVPANELVSISSEGNYVRLETKSGEYLERHVLGELAEKLEPYGVQVSRSTWVAFSAIDEQVYKNGSLTLVLKNKKQISAASRRTKEVRDRLAAFEGRDMTS